MQAKLEAPIICIDSGNVPMSNSVTDVERGIYATITSITMIK